MEPEPRDGGDETGGLEHLSFSKLSKATEEQGSSEPAGGRGRLRDAEEEYRRVHSEEKCMCTHGVFGLVWSGFYGFQKVLRLRRLRTSGPDTDLRDDDSLRS